MSALATGRSIVETAREKDVAFMAASIAYYAVASFVPLLLLALALVSLVGVRETLITVLRSVLSASGSDVLNGILSNMSGHGVAGVVGALLALWSGSKVFRGLTVAFDEIYSRQSDLSLSDQLKKSVLALATLFLGFVVLCALGVALTFVDVPVRYPTLVGNLVAVVALCLAFLPIFYIMPPVDVTIRHAFPGAVVAAVGWVLLQIGFYYYAGSAGKYAAYGLLGAFLLFITFLYIAAIVLLVGVVVNAALDL
jgi:membrane protein